MCKFSEQHTTGSQRCLVLLMFGIAAEVSLAGCGCAGSVQTQIAYSSTNPQYALP